MAKAKPAGPSDTLKRLLDGQDDIRGAIAQLHEIVVGHGDRLESIDARLGRVETDLVAIRAALDALAIKDMAARLDAVEARLAALEAPRS